MLGAGCGLTQGEIFGLRVKDADFLRRRILVRRQVKVIDNHPVLGAPKGKWERELPLPEVVAVALTEHLRRVGLREQVFTWRNGGLIRRTYYNNGVWKPALRILEIEASRENGMHALRHHYASVLPEGRVSGSFRSGIHVAHVRASDARFRGSCESGRRRLLPWPSVGSRRSARD